MLARLLVVSLWLGATVAAQASEPPSQNVATTLLRGATVHTGQQTLPHTDVLIKGERIVALGRKLEAPPHSQIIDLTGQHLYPALIALSVQAGLKEIGMVRSTVDSHEVGPLNPQLKASTAFNPDSAILPTLRANGIGYIQTTPQGVLLAGHSALISLSGWNLRDRLIQADSGLHLYWPTISADQRDPKQHRHAMAHYHQQHQRLLKAFDDAQRYRLALEAGRSPVQDTRWHAMLPVLRGKVPLMVHADDKRQILHALSLAQQHQLKLILIGGYDAYQLQHQLQQAQVPVIYTHATGLPKRADEPYDLPYQIPSLLHQAGIPFALAWPGSWDSRSLAFAAGQAVAYGLPKEIALAAITQRPAQLLGLQELGEIKPGAVASLVSSRGDLLDMSTAGVHRMWLAGQPVDLDNRHSRLYRKYQQRQR
ncbi:amidohydrolase [Ferrimonas pelagia]|uniref:Amidohydrolase n=1 Tax=Ferrimonas pelagia TaxID=1177826 RepID=A0ABP9EBV4_9GAMM